MIDIVTVVNDFKMYDACIKNNPFMNCFNLIAIDNRTNPKGITEHYNNYIKTKMQDDTWIIFCHQDFSFKENISKKVEMLQRNSIYGVIGTRPETEFVFFMRLKGYKIKKFKFGFRKTKTRIGQIEEGEESNSKLEGKYIKEIKTVDTVDCCCAFLHSSLIKTHELKFDETLKWHLYSEDFSLNARERYGVPTKVVQLSSRHISRGTFSGDFYDSLGYVKSKYPDIPFTSTCFDGYYDKFKESL